MTTDTDDGATAARGGSGFPSAADRTGMTAADRRAFVREVLEESGVALKSVDVYRACRLRGATFSHRSTAVYLNALVEAGDVLKVDSAALDDGAIVEIPTGERGHFIAARVAAELGGA